MFKLPVYLKKAPEYAVFLVFHCGSRQNSDCGNFSVYFCPRKSFFRNMKRCEKPGSIPGFGGYDPGLYRMGSVFLQTIPALFSANYDLIRRQTREPPSVLPFSAFCYRTRRTVMIGAYVAVQIPMPCASFMALTMVPSPMYRPTCPSYNTRSPGSAWS